MDIKKIKNSLYYNWIKIAAIVFAVVFIAVTFMQCSQRKETDLGIMYVGKAVVSENLPKLAQEIEKTNIISDADEDGEITLNTKAIVIPLSKEKMIEQQVPEQIQVEIISGENLLYILEKETLISYAVDESFADITDLAEKFNISKENCLSYEDGSIYAIPAGENALLKELEIETSGMYFALRNYLPKDKDKLTNVNAKNALKYILERKN
mgnify:CR=1 FL=1